MEAKASPAAPAEGTAVAEFVAVPPRYRTVNETDHERLVEQMGQITPSEFSHETGGCALNRHSMQSMMGRVQMKTGCVFCGDLLLRGDIDRGSIEIGKCVVLGESVLVRPPVQRVTDSDLRIIPVSIGEHVFVGQRCVVESSRIGSCVVIEEDCVLGPESEVHHGAWVKNGSVVPRAMKLMPFGVYEGHPARLVGQMNPDSGLFEMRDLVLDVIRRTGLLSHE